MLFLVVEPPDHSLLVICHAQKEYKTSNLLGKFVSPYMYSRISSKPCPLGTSPLRTYLPTCLPTRIPIAACVHICLVFPQVRQPTTKQARDCFNVSQKINEQRPFLGNILATILNYPMDPYIHPYSSLSKPNIDSRSSLIPISSHVPSHLPFDSPLLGYYPYTTLNGPSVASSFSNALSS